MKPPSGSYRSKGFLHPGLASVALVCAMSLGAPIPAVAQQAPDQPEVRDLASDVDRLVRRLYLATPEDGRMGVLASLLGDPSAAVVKAALDLASREQAAGVRLHDDTVAAVLLLLTHADPGVRLKAASVVDLLADPRAREPLSWALAAEQNEAVAQILLRIAARWPDALERTSIIRWLNPEQPMGSGLGRALVELDLIGRLHHHEDRQPILDSIGLVPDADLSLSMCRLLARLGDEPQHQRLLLLLTHPDAGLRRRAATALAEQGGYDQHILNAGRRDPALYDTVAQIAQRMPAEQGLRILLHWPSDDSPAALDRISGIADRLPITTLLRLHDPALSPARRVAMLDGIPGRTVPTASRAQGLVLLGSALLELSQFARAADVIELAEPLIDTSSPWHERAQSIRYRAEIALADR